VAKIGFPFNLWVVAFCSRLEKFMRSPITELLCALLFLPLLSGSRRETSGPPTSAKAHVMVLGTFHFVRGQADMYRVNPDDVLAPKRHKEVAAVIAILKKYGPTKIAVEAPFGSEKLQKQYQEYRAGTYQLTGDEIEQIGFRLAKELDQQQIYGIDSKSDMDFDRVMHFAQEHGQTAALQKLMQAGSDFVKELDADLAKGTVLDVLHRMNSRAELQRNHELNMGMALIGEDTDYPGADVVGQWYTRNLRIYLRRVLQGPDDRVLVLFGQGHEFLLQQYVADSGDLVLDLFNDLN
jgi:hypothetical protein